MYDMFNVKKPDSFNVQCFMISKHRFTLQTKLNIHVVHELKPHYIKLNNFHKDKKIYECSWLKCSVLVLENYVLKNADLPLKCILEQ